MIRPSIHSRTLLVVALLLVALISAQAAASASTAGRERLQTSRVLGRSGFAFLTGARTLGAAILWNRLEPLLHDYYEEVPFEEQRYALPTLRMITLLDPQFISAYSISSFMIAEGGDVDEGLGIAREGLRNNSESGQLHANLTQILMLENAEKNMPELLELSKRGISEEVKWLDANDLFEGLAVFRAVFRLSGDTETTERIQNALDQLRASGQIAEDHDHDGDGTQDH